MAKEIVLPEGWEVDKVENGKIILKEAKSKYPQTWEKCMIKIGEVEVIGIKSNIAQIGVISPKLLCVNHFNCLPTGYGKKVLALCQLLICRNAYWGDWRPDWKNPIIKYTIRMNRGKVFLDECEFYHQILAFPSPEMRDVFYKNFKDLIEEAKDLL